MGKFFAECAGVAIQCAGVAILGLQGWAYAQGAIDTSKAKKTSDILGTSVDNEIGNINKAEAPATQLAKGLGGVGYIAGIEAQKFLGPK